MNLRTGNKVTDALNQKDILSVKQRIFATPHEIYSYDT